MAEVTPEALAAELEVGGEHATGGTP